MAAVRPLIEAASPAEAAAQWWAKAVAAPDFNNGDPIASALGTMLAARSAEPTQTASQRFVEVLAGRLEQRLTQSSYVSVNVDYGPDLLLADAATEAGIDGHNRFPWKTHMWVYRDRVVVSAGYRARHELVWASPEWLANRPVCGEQYWNPGRAEEATYHGDPWCCSLPQYHEEPHQFDQPLALCARCGRPDDWYHQRDERGHMADFHEFEGP